MPLPGGALLVDTPGLRLVAPLEDADEPVPLLDKAQVKRDRRAREREFHRGIYREMREKRRSRERRDRRQGLTLANVNGGMVGKLGPDPRE